MPSGGPILELRRISKHFPAHRAVNDVSLEVPRGSFFALLGPSGCGKTTTLRMIAGFDAPTSGEILLDGDRMDGLPPYRRNVNTVFQNYALFPHLTVRENVEFGLTREARKTPEAGRRVAKVIDQVRLSGKESRMPAQLSGGERQRVALARALVLQPAVLLLDEPLSALDPQLRKQVRSELKDLQRETGTTFLFVTHDQEEALSMSDHIAVMHQGEVEQVGSPREIYATPRTRFVAGFLGAMNWVDGVGVRPEATRISRGPLDTGVPSRAARISGVHYLGYAVQVEARTDRGDRMLAQLPSGDADAAVSAGEQVHFWWPAEAELRFES